MVKLLNKQSEKEIVEAIRDAERTTSGQIHVHLKSGDTKDIMEEAKKVFHKLRMQRTKHRNSVLILVAPKARKFAILGDEGIHGRAGQDFWHATRDAMAGHFSKGQMKEGIIAGVRSAGEKLREHFPAGQNNPNELSDNITEG
jgi:uncharacterized membrane protein